MITVRISPSFARKLIVAGMLAVLAAPITAAAQSSFAGIVVFGTSLSDPGNVFALNGATWIEQYAETVGLAGSVGAALANNGSATNFAGLQRRHQLQPGAPG